MVSVAQLVERWIVAPVVVGSSPITHPLFPFVPERMQRLNTKPGWFFRRRLLKELIRSIDSDRFSTIRSRYQNASPDPGYSKYLDLKYWLNVNLKYALHLNLHKTPSASILDLGTGCGYFPFICRLLGHSVQALDTEEVSMYREMTELLQVPRTIHKIMAMEPLPDSHSPFNVITAFLICFNNHKQPDLWKEAEWNFLLDDLMRLSAPNARVFFVLNPETDGQFYSTELKSLFKKRGARIDGANVDFIRGIQGI